MRGGHRCAVPRFIATVWNREDTRDSPRRSRSGGGKRGGAIEAAQRDRRNRRRGLSPQRAAVHAARRVTRGTVVNDCGNATSDLDLGDLVGKRVVASLT